MLERAATASEAGVSDAGVNLQFAIARNSQLRATPLELEAHRHRYRRAAIRGVNGRLVERGAHACQVRTNGVHIERRREGESETGCSWSGTHRLAHRKASGSRVCGCVQL